MDFHSKGLRRLYNIYNMNRQKNQKLPLSPDQLATGLLKAREARRLTLKLCSQLLGIPVSRLQNYEEGKYIPSLPEIEALAFIYGLPIKALFNSSEIEHFIREPNAEKLQQLIRIRGHIISTRLQIALDQSGKTLEGIAKATGLSPSRIRKYLDNKLEIPYNDLGSLSDALGVEMCILFDTESTMGQWLTQQERLARFSEQPEDIQQKVIEKGNVDLLRAADRLMAFDQQTLQALIEALQKILELQTSPQDNSGEDRLADEID